MDKLIEYNGYTLVMRDVLFDYLLGDMPEYESLLANSGLDYNPEHWNKFTTCYGNFIHFRNTITNEIL